MHCNSTNQTSGVYNSLVSQETLEALCRGSHEAYDQVYSRYQKPVCDFIYALTCCREVAEDITHEVFVSVWENRQNLDPSQGIRRYLFAVAKNLVMRHFRQKKTEGHYLRYCQQRPIESDGSDKWLFAKEADALIRAATAKMPRIRGQIFKMYYRDGLSYDAIAQKLNMNKATIANHLCHAKNDIKHVL
ncbi:MAG: sigma-70 family RNA polymerase sigma factor [Bacteroidales bacterium]|nr:sigma-70 family RNA polymerase sigma factor [Bacteroidales bacterium]MCL2739357.1 sigma-70 family RNA polymerase sigma factor [Bacteroidales bacterium]